MPVPAVSLETFRARFPEFDGVRDSLVALQLEEAQADLHPSLFGDALPRLVGFLTAHRLAISVDEDGNPIGDQPGAMSMASADGVSASYKIPERLSARDIALWSSSYGQRFYELRNPYVAGPQVVC